jgi:hypothetical protein
LICLPVISRIPIGLLVEECLFGGPSTTMMRISSAEPLTNGLGHLHGGLSGHRQDDVLVENLFEARVLVCDVVGDQANILGEHLARYAVAALRDLDGVEADVDGVVLRVQYPELEQVEGPRCRNSPS